jgi:FkbM family methyltransferase
MRALHGPRALRERFRRVLGRSGEAVLATLADMARGDIELRVDEFDGVFAINPRSELFRRLLRFRQYEPELAQVFRAHVDPCRDIVDVGANIGFFTVLGAKALRGGRVLAVEPTGAAFARLVANAARNGVADRVIAFNGAAAAAEGQFAMNVVPGREEYSSVGALVHPRVRGAPQVLETVPATTLDALVARHDLHPGIVKVDVEGAEHLVFEGARMLLERHRPVVISELAQPLLRACGADARDIIRLFERLDYRVSDPVDPGAPPGSKVQGDILCVPK